MSTVPTRSEFSARVLTTVIMLMLAMIVCFIYLQVRNAGLFVVGPDEWHYSRSARLMPLASVEFTSYLYFLIYRATNVCGSGFMDCARMLNSAFLVAAMPFLYLVCRQVAPRPLAFLVAVLAVFGPVNTYTALFIPEAMYFFMFWVLAWAALRSAEVRPLVYGVLLGVILGLMGLVKTHALFLVPAVVAFLVFRYFWSGTAEPAKKALVALAGLFAAAVLVRFGLGFLFAGPAGLTLFGEFYGAIAPSTADAGRYTHLVSQALVSLKGHAMALTALFALPLAAIFYFPAKHEGHTGMPRASREIRLFAFFVFACLLLVTTLFSAKVAGGNEMETIARLHMRYYLFALPLLLIIAAEQAGPASPRQLSRALPAAVVVAILAILAITSLLPSYTPGFVDSPELWGIAINPFVFGTIVALGLLSLIAWLFDTRLGARLFLFGVFPLIVVVSGWRANENFGHYMRPDRYSDAGLFARRYLGDSREPVLVVGSEHSAVFRAMFYLDNPNATKLVQPTFEPIVQSSVPAGTKWILVVGDQDLPKGARWETGFGGSSLARVGAEDIQTVDFTQASWSGLSIAGLSGAEAWGTWSDGKRVVMKFSRPLPRGFTLVLKAHASGDTSEPTTVVVGQERREFRLPSPRELSLSFVTDGNVHAISFEIPWAKTFQEQGIASPDMRRLGIGFVSIRIIPTVSNEALVGQ